MLNHERVSSLEQYVKVFKAFRSVKMLYLPHFSETNVWGFRLVMTGISEISEDFPKEKRKPQHQQQKSYHEA